MGESFPANMTVAGFFLDYNKYDGFFMLSQEL